MPAAASGHRNAYGAQYTNPALLSPFASVLLASVAKLRQPGQPTSFAVAASYFAVTHASFSQLSSAVSSASLPLARDRWHFAWHLRSFATMDASFFSQVSTTGSSGILSVSSPGATGVVPSQKT